MSLNVELYRFSQGVFHVGFTSGTTTISYNGVTYNPLTVERNDLQVTDDVYQSSVTVNFPRSEQFALDLLNFSNDQPWNFSLFKGELGSNNYPLKWQGRVVSSKADDDIIQVECESMYTTIKRPGLRARYSKTCRHELYDKNCSKAEWWIKATITAISSTSLSVDVSYDVPVGHFTAGVLQLSNLEYRFILSNESKTSITINRPIYNAKVGDSVYLAYGCDHSKEICHSRFNNLANFGGFPWIPTSNPFTTRIQ